MSFILGGILIAAALFGGGLEIKELKLPQIGAIARFLSSAVGVAFVGLALYLHLKVPETISRQPDVAVQAPKPNSTQPEEPLRKTSRTFQKPMFGDSRLDVCLQWAQNCGEPAATPWCKTKGMSRAVDYPQENVGERGITTRLIGTGQVCKEKFCASFVYITCEK
jgi:hypothetical protein